MALSRLRFPLFAAPLTDDTVTPSVATFLRLLRDVAADLTPRWPSG